MVASVSLCKSADPLTSGDNSLFASGSTSAQEIQGFLAAAYERMEFEKGKLRLLIPQAESASGLVKLMQNHPYGFLNAEISGMADARLEQLTQADQTPSEASNAQELRQQMEKALQKKEELGRQITEAANRLKSLNGDESLSNKPTRPVQTGARNNSVERRRMEGNVQASGLVNGPYEARKLSDDELQSLNSKALQLLELRRLKNETRAARRMGY